MKNCVEISKSRSLKQPLKIRVIGNNSEPLAGTETLTTRANVKKNLLAQMRVFNGTWCWVNDTVTKETYILHNDGTRSKS